MAGPTTAERSPTVMMQVYRAVAHLWCTLSRLPAAAALVTARAVLASARATADVAAAQRLTVSAQAVLARRSLAQARCEARAGRVRPPVARRFGIGPPHEDLRLLLLRAVARANRSRAVWAREIGVCTVVGHPADLDAIEVLFASVQRQAAGLLDMTDGSPPGPRRVRELRQGLADHAVLVGQLLADVNRRVTAQADAQPRAVLAEREVTVRQATRRLFPQVTSPGPATAGGPGLSPGWRPTPATAAATAWPPARPARSRPGR